MYTASIPVVTTRTSPKASGASSAAGLTRETSPFALVEEGDVGDIFRLVASVACEHEGCGFGCRLML